MPGEVSRSYQGPADEPTKLPDWAFRPIDKPERKEILHASGECICEICGKEYRRHPEDLEELSYDGNPFLHMLCDGTQVKL